MAARRSLKQRTLLVTFILGLTQAVGLAADQTRAGEPTQALTPLPVPLQSMTGDEVFARLLKHNQLREVRLQRYSARRSYEVANDRGKVYAQELVREDYRAPDHKTLVTQSAKGSALVRDLVLNRLIATESEASSGRAHYDSSIKPANYEFNLLGQQDVGPYHCLVVEARPRRKDKYLFEGKVWIDAEDYAIVRIAGQPAKSLSFWITRADFVREYRKIGEFWLPAKDQTFVHMRFYGMKVLTIDHMDYVVNQGAGGSVQSGTVENKTSER